MMTSTQTITIGLDIGGTKTHGLRIEDGIPMTEMIAGSANVQNVSRESAAANLAEVFDALGEGTIDSVYAGAGGIDTPEDAEELRELIARFAPNAHIEVVHDSRLLLAAAKVRTGIAVIAGTGSAVWGRNARGVEARTGGWGYLLGDEGSGYWLGREAVRYSLRRMNLGQGPDALTQRLLLACELDHPNQLISLFHSPATGRRYWAQHARLVVEAAAGGHGPSQELVERAGKDLAVMAHQTLSQLGISGPVVVGGGLGTGAALLQKAFQASLAESGITDIRYVDQDPVFGAVHLATDFAANP